MKTWKDTEGREWQVRINRVLAKQVLDRLNIDLFGVDKSSFAMKLASGDVSLVFGAMIDVLYVLCEDQCKALGISDEQFAASFGGDVFDDAQTALLTEWLDFFPKAQRAAMSRALEKAGLLKARIIEKATAEIEGLEVEAIAEKVAVDLRRQMSGEFSVSGKASPA